MRKLCGYERVCRQRRCRAPSTERDLSPARPSGSSMGHQVFRYPETECPNGRPTGDRRATRSSRRSRRRVRRRFQRARNYSNPPAAPRTRLAGTRVRITAGTCGLDRDGRPGCSQVGCLARSAANGTDAAPDEVARLPGWWRLPAKPGCSRFKRRRRHAESCNRVETRSAAERRRLGSARSPVFGSGRNYTGTMPSKEEVLEALRQVEIPSSGWTSSTSGSSTTSSSKAPRRRCSTASRRWAARPGR